MRVHQGVRHHGDEQARRYRCVLRPALRVAQTCDRQKDVREGLEGFVRDLEAAIRREPYQWFCFRRIWPRGEC